MAEPAQEIRRGRKYDQVLDGARAVFLAEGFEGASVDAIARVAGVSKATLYSYFPDKRLLFMEVVRAECLRQADAAGVEIDLSAPPEVVLRAGARRIVAFYCSDFGRNVHRICVAESARFPELGRRFYASGAELARARIGDYLAAACARGELAIDDIPLAADQFVKLCEADLMDRVTCGLRSGFTEAEIARVVDGAVAMFLACYEVR
jgi:TetR/AcrR family transcriptional repressor of mexJK operon